MINLIDKLHQENFLSAEEFHRLLANRSQEDEEYARNLANQVRQQVYGNKIYVRGLIEFTNYCKNDCFYCGIRRSNREAQRYRLTEEDILTCCAEGYELGFRTFVLQGGEDPFFTDEKIVHMIHEIKKKYPDCALTLSIGEKSEESYRAFREAGADRYLLRHETADTRHYSRLHPYEMSCEHRKNCLRTLKKLGFQTGAGFMVGSPLQTIDDLVADFLFLKELDPEMVGIGPFIPHPETPLAGEPGGSLHLALRTMAIMRLLLPDINIPATTAMESLHPDGRMMALQGGANVVMPNVTEGEYRKLYELYPGKICVNDTPVHCRSCISRKILSIGRTIGTGYGSHRDNRKAAS